MSLSPGTRLGPYEVGTLLGVGGMGEVYRARDPRLQRDVAIKVLPANVASDPERLARFAREAQLLASLNHPHIAHVYGVEQDATTRALVMELVDGPTLADRIAGGPIPLEEALPIARQIADALDAAHERGIIHRDLKPANVKLTSDGTVKVLDFGLAKALGAGETSEAGQSRADEILNSPTITTPAMTQAGMILGTAAYMSPEQARGKPVDKRADIWAFGVVVYEMLTGRQLFAGETVSDTIAEVLKREFDWQALPAATPPGIRRVLEHALQRDPRKRLRDVGDAIAELDAPPGVEKAVTVLRPARASVASVSLIVLAVAASAAAAWLLKPPPPEAPKPVVRFTIPVDESLRSVTRQAIAVSPDGSTLAIAAGTGILLRRLDDVGVTPLPNTDNAGFMAFSPDGKSLAFSSAGQIKTVELGASAPQTVWSSGMSGNAVAGLTWSAEGVLAFDFGDGIHLLRPGSGTATPLKSDGLYAGLPHFLPDGQSVLYYIARTATPDSHVVVWHPLSGGEPVELIKGSAPQFVPPDRLLFTRGSTLFAVRLDLTAKRVIGDAEVVTDQVLAGGSNQTPHFAVARTGDLYYLDGGIQGMQGATLLRMRSGAEPAGMLDDARNFVDVRLSPDGRKLALHLADQDDDIWVLDVARRVLNRVTFVAGEDETPAWSPDGTELAFASTRLGEQERKVLIARADGSGNERVVWRYTGHAHVSDWSPDGRWLLVEVVTPGRGIQLIDLKDPQTTAKPFQETSFSQSNARVSPNGRWMTYMSNESGRNEIYVQAFPQGGNKIRVSTGGGITPIWSRDGLRLFYRSETHVMAVIVSDKPELAISAPQPLLADDYGRPLGDTHTSFDVTPEGDFVFTRPVSPASSIKPRMNGVLNWAQGLR